VEPRESTVDMSRFSGRVTASWFNSTDGRTKPVADPPPANKGTHKFRTPVDNGTKNNDWFLVIECKS
jgi:hypothetical protein